MGSNMSRGLRSMRFSASDRRLICRGWGVSVPACVKLLGAGRLSMGLYSSVHENLDVDDADVRIGHASYSWSRMSRVTCGNYCSIAKDVEFSPGQHPTDRLTTHPCTYIPDAWPYEPFPIRRIGFEAIQKPVTVGHDCWIGTGAVIMGGVTVGTGAVVAARAVVTHDVPPYAIVAGVPARIVRYRFDERTRAALLASAWWEYDLQNWSAPVDWTDVPAALSAIAAAAADGSLRRLPDWEVTERDLSPFNGRRRFVAEHTEKGDFLKVFGRWIRLRLRRETA